MTSPDSQEAATLSEAEETSMTNPALKARIEEISKVILAQNYHLYKELENK